MVRTNAISIDLRNRCHIAILFPLFLFFLPSHLKAWDFWPLPMAEADTANSEIRYGFEAIGVFSTAQSSPFWLHTNRNGHISAEPFSSSVAVWVSQDATRPNRWYDYDFSIDLAGRFDGKKQTGYFRSLYAHIRLYVFDITAGIKPISYGSQDQYLTTGGLLFSNNAQPLPRITIGIDRYTAIPGLYGYAELKGGITHAWFVDNSQLDPSFETTGALLHHKFAGLRVGGKLPVNIAYEFHHAAQWGGHSPLYGDMSTNLKSFKNIFLIRAGGINISDQLNAEGNHIGWQELSLSFKYDGWKANMYWQYIFEDKSAAFIGAGINVYDGLWGINISQNKWSYINSLTYEFINTTHQDGPYHDKDGIVYGGRDSYFYNSSYQQGWTHFHRSIGSPFVLPNNNRVRTHFVGISGDIYGFFYRLKGSYTRNWGTYQQPVYSENTALLLEVSKTVQKAWGMEFGLALGADIGTQFGNNFGAMITIRKNGLIFSY